MAWYDLLIKPLKTIQDFRGALYEFRHRENEDEVELDRTERGASGSAFEGDKVVRPEYNSDWQGEAGVALAEKMRKSDGSIRSVLQVIKLPLLRATWSVKVHDEETADEEDRKHAKFCHEQLFNNEKVAWIEVLRHILLMLDFGFSTFEKVYTLVEKTETTEGGKNVGLGKLAVRHPSTIKDIIVKDGQIRLLVQQADKNGKNQELKIQGKYVVCFSYDKEGDNFWGVSMLRYIYSHYFYKTEFYRIDAVRLNRFGVGIPDAEVKEGYTLKPNEKTMVVNTLKGLRSNDQAYILRPEQVKIRIMTPDNEHGGVSGLLESVDHHDVMIARSALAHFLTAGSQRHGNYGTTTAWADMFLYALQALARDICVQMDQEIIKDLCDFNFNMKGRNYPKCSASTLEDTNMKELAAALYNLTLGQLVTPTDGTEAHLRTLYAMPPLEKEETRAARKARGELPTGPLSPATVAPNTITGKPSDDDREAARAAEPPPGTLPSTSAPARGPVRSPQDRG